MYVSTRLLLPGDLLSEKIVLTVEQQILGCVTLQIKTLEQSGCLADAGFITSDVALPALILVHLHHCLLFILGLHLRK